MFSSATRAHARPVVARVARLVVLCVPHCRDAYGNRHALMHAPLSTADARLRLALAFQQLTGGTFWRRNVGGKGALKGSVSLSVSATTVMVSLGDCLPGLDVALIQLPSL